MSERKGGMKSHPISLFLAVTLAYVVYALDRTVMSQYVGPLDGDNTERNLRFIYEQLGMSPPPGPPSAEKNAIAPTISTKMRAGIGKMKYR